MKCLIVDDEIFCREFVATLLKDIAECRQAGSGKEAVAKYTEALESGSPYDLIILDIMMPDMSGHDVAKEIRALEKERKAGGVKIIMLTALNSPTDAMDSFFNAQSAAYLVKPISKDGLFNVIGKLGLGRKK
ncbi:response regulator [Geomonas sp. RF6]|uniref:response regulator n=1 Tax=Geomonas sp. RF6 TaxID=2897342 RepID=UPI001E50470C|nr:response regulator [Geomonas sp. RF6]UFS69519.1 response regulator [Geomonas sp. RF6]